MFTQAKSDTTVVIENVSFEDIEMFSKIIDKLLPIELDDYNFYYDYNYTKYEELGNKSGKQLMEEAQSYSELAVITEKTRSIWSHVKMFNIVFNASLSSRTISLLSDQAEKENNIE